MERLVTTTQAAQILGLSLQGIHYRIKKEQLKSIKKSGRIFVYISDDMEKNTSYKNIDSIKDKKEPSLDNIHYSELIKVKDEQIVLLKDSITWIKKQYKSEIVRLEKNQKRIVKVFNSEIKLLQSAFNEMRTIYKNQPNQIEQKSTEIEFISVKEFFLIMKNHGKSENEIKSIILNAIKSTDKRFIYNKTEKKLLILKSSFEDLI